MRKIMTFQKMKTICIVLSLMFSFLVHAEVPAFDNDKPATTFTSDYSQTYNKIWDASYLPGAIDPATIVNYDISMDFEINNQVAGPLIALTDASNFFMWQIYVPGDGNSWFRPHSWINGAFALMGEVNITSTAPVAMHSVYTLKIEIRGDKASTYINNVLIDLNRVNPRGAGVNYGYANLGFRQLSTAEDAYYDNIKMTTIISGNPVTLYDENFSTSSLSYTLGTVTSGRLHEVNNADLAFATSWDGTTFNAQWDAVDAFDANEVKNGYAFFYWPNRRILRSKSTYTTPYSFTSDIDLSDANNRGGVVIRASAAGGVDLLQEPTTGTGFNREGIAFYPSSDGASMIVQFTGTENGASTTFTQILVPKPVGVSTLLTRATLKIEDFGSSIYVYYNNVRFIRINLGGLSSGIYTTGTVYNSDMTSLGTFSGMEVESVGKVAVAQRGATIKLYSVNMGTTTIADAPTAIVATAGNAQASVSFTAPVNNGGTEILDYTVTSSPGGLTATGASSPITVTGLTNNTAYTFTVTARNAAGASVASAASSAVTPSVGTGLNKVTAKFNAYQNESAIVIEMYGLSGLQVVSVFDLQGKRLVNQLVVGGQKTSINKHLSTGVYIIETKGNQGTFKTKLVVK